MYVVRKLTDVVGQQEVKKWTSDISFLNFEIKEPRHIYYGIGNLLHYWLRLINAVIAFDAEIMFGLSDIELF